MSGTEADTNSTVLNGNAQKSGVKEDDIRHLREWLPKQPHLPPISDRQLSLFLHACYNSLEKAKKAIDQYFTIRGAVPELFSSMNPMRPEIQKTFDVVDFVKLPEVTPKGGYCVYYARLSKCDPQEYDFESSLKTFIMIIDVQLLTDGLLPGYALVLDAKGVTLGHIPKINIPLIKKFLVYVQEALPIRLKQIHIINAFPLVDKIYAMLKPFLKGEIMDMIQFHKPGDLSNFYEYVAQEIMPKDFGGNAATIESLHNSTQRTVEGNRESLQVIEQVSKTDESKRPGQPRGHGEIFGMEGSFRRLAID